MLAILFFLPALSAQEKRDSVIVSLITCWPGSEIYELCGHEALRVQDGKNDLVYNYGTFDFTAPNFVYRFLKGETDYMLSRYPFAWFMPEYVETGRKVVEQRLNLTQAEARKLAALLQKQALPENATYRYNYVLDNCATRIVDDIDRCAGETVVWPDSVKYGSFRREMRQYHRDYPWYQFGIDLCLGSGIDIPIRAREEMFVPLEMMEKAAGAHFADGRPLVSETIVLNEGVADATLGPTPWWQTPLFTCWLAAAALLIACAGMVVKKRIFPALFSIWFGILGIVGLLIAFLVFVSSHYATSPNMLLLWLNPLQLIIAAGVWWKSWRLPVRAMIYCDIVAVGVLAIVWPFQAQSANPAFFPLMWATLALAICYAIIPPKGSYNIEKKKENRRHNEKISDLGDRRSGNTRRGGGSRSASSPRGGNRR